MERRAGKKRRERAEGEKARERIDLSFVIARAERRGSTHRFSRFHQTKMNPGADNARENTRLEIEGTRNMRIHNNLFAASALCLLSVPMAPFQRSFMQNSRVTLGTRGYCLRTRAPVSPSARVASGCFRSRTVPNSYPSYTSAFIPCFLRFEKIRGSKRRDRRFLGYLKFHRHKSSCPRNGQFRAKIDTIATDR